ncbi:DUF4160 domain-containing protein [Afifella sp. H1R]|uniref:DUF4160 domain-containing protein n=1 Tax=unclassified Afifella TaxID=2624128 RepID=UPI001F42662E|nr:DUF4160 domain-containing protein [Afifella sp. H1R]MCF1504738.1 DUF4160 domain-containing protein [Afifella sp. H1R]
MVTVLRSGAFRVVIFTDDHAPAHVHVFGDGMAKIDISGATPRLIETTMTKGELRKVAALIDRHQTALRQRWRDIHG